MFHVNWRSLTQTKRSINPGFTLSLCFQSKKGCRLEKAEILEIAVQFIQDAVIKQREQLQGVKKKTGINLKQFVSGLLNTSKKLSSLAVDQIKRCIKTHTTAKCYTGPVLIESYSGIKVCHPLNFKDFKPSFSNQL